MAALKHSVILEPSFEYPTLCQALKDIEKSKSNNPYPLLNQPLNPPPANQRKIATKQEVLRLHWLLQDLETQAHHLEIEQAPI